MMPSLTGAKTTRARHHRAPARLLLAVCLALLLSPALALAPRPARAAGPDVVYFPQTGHHLSGTFLDYWRANGDITSLGYPLSEPFEREGHTVQYFERAVFELHPESAGTPWEVQLALLGSRLAMGRTEPAFAPLPSDTPSDSPGRMFFPETGHSLAYGFKNYWEQNGGLWQFGYPISEEFTENGLTVQYFERARFEWRPENAGTPWEVLLGRLGADAAAADGIDISPVARQDNVPDYDPGLWAPPPGPRALTIPVLLYHRFGDPAERYQVPYWSFEQQLDWLQANGYTTVTLAEVYDYMAGIGELPARPVVITFDDGSASQWGAALGLEARGMRGVFFITTSQPRLSDGQLRQLAAAGHEIDALTLSHADLTAISDAQLRAELRDARATLQAITGQPVDFLAYPYGAYNARVIAAAQAAGYRGAVTAWGGTWWSPDTIWSEPRVEVAGWLTIDGFAALVQ